jgi:4-hydroxy-3-methylbut-2-enyl diphosphate reductase
MKVYLAEGSGFCFGVKRAMDMAYKYTVSSSGRDIYSLHEIIHNPQEVARLEKAGAKHVESIDDIKQGSYVIISTHGITWQEEEKLREKCADVLDTTCPYVKKIHNIAKKLAEENYRVIIIGDAEHLEVKGITGYAQGAVVAGSLKDISGIELSEKTGVVSQTTQDIGVFESLLAGIQNRAFQNRYAEVRAFNTICDATKKRQAATMELAKRTDIMVVAGGKNSANTKRLYELSRSILKDVYQVESAYEIKSEWFTGKKSAGVSAGASTPENVIKEVVEKIKTIGEK